VPVPRVDAAMIVAGVDPGGARTGMVIRDGDKLVAHRLVVRSDRQPLDDYLDKVLQAFHQIAAVQPVDVVAVEETNAPTGPMGITALGGLLDTAWVGGAVLAQCRGRPWRPVLVPPGAYGSGPPQAYPSELWGPREGVAGTGRMQHVRASWDCAGAAKALLRQIPLDDGGGAA